MSERLLGITAARRCLLDLVVWKKVSFLRLDVWFLGFVCLNSLQEEIHELLLSFAKAGANVVRLKGGDPLVSFLFDFAMLACIHLQFYFSSINSFVVCCLWNSFGFLLCENY